MKQKRINVKPEKRKTLGDKIRENAERNRKRRDETGASAQRALKFKTHYYFLNDKDRLIGNKLFDKIELSVGYKQDEKREMFEILLANLICFRRHFISISMNQTTWKSSIYHPITKVLTEYVHTLHDCGYIDLKKGYYNREGDGRNTRIRAAEKLIKLFSRTQRKARIKIIEPIELRNEERRTLEYKKVDESKYIKKVRSVLHQANEINNVANIRLNNFNIDTGLVAIYKGDFNNYGRLHTSGKRHVQGLRKKERSEITINDEKTIEYDYKALHPNLLYVKLGIQYEGDPYLLNANSGILTEGDPCLQFTEHELILRDFCKMLFVCLINGEKEGVNSTIKAANYALRKRRKKSKYDYPFTSLDIKPTLEKLKKKHERIKKYYYGGRNSAMKLMNKDAYIAICIIDYFVTRGIPILPIHDSFIVQRKHGAKLKQVMQESYRKYTSNKQFPQGFKIIISEASAKSKVFKCN